MTSTPTLTASVTSPIFLSPVDCVQSAFELDRLAFGRVHGVLEMPFQLARVVHFGEHWMLSLLAGRLTAFLALGVAALGLALLDRLPGIAVEPVVAVRRPFAVLRIGHAGSPFVERMPFSGKHAGACLLSLS